MADWGLICLHLSSGNPFTPELSYTQGACLRIRLDWHNALMLYYPAGFYYDREIGIRVMWFDHKTSISFIPNYL
jgi:hypothetical protein